MRVIVFGIPRLKHVGLLNDLTRIAQKLGAVIGQRHAAVASHENGNAQFLLKFFDGNREVRL